MVFNLPRPFLVFSLPFCWPKAAWGLSTTSVNTSNAFCDSLNLDVAKIKKTIHAGRVYHQRNFLTEAQVQLLLKEISDLENKGEFKRSGLSNTVKGSEQDFGNRDRTLCAVPWWKDSLLGEKTGGDIDEVASMLQQLRLALAHILDRPTMMDAGLDHECYYSKSAVGSFLPRHMDERHEELKGSKGWLLPSRRSLSWLVYLSDKGWDLEKNGGALRSFPQKNIATGETASHDGNLQVGWLLQSNAGSKPVYLDSWFPLATQAQTTEPHCILYTVDGKDRVPLTRPWTNDALVGMSVADFINAFAARDAKSPSATAESLFLNPKEARSFVLLEDRAAWEAGAIPEGSTFVDVSPERASLVVFDSVLVPHEVRVIEQGTRVALAGWFHEETQPFPEDLYA